MLARSAARQVARCARAQPQQRGIAGGRALRQQQRGQEPPRDYEAPVPVGKNIAVAGALMAFVGGTYLYTVQRIQTNTELGPEFTEVLSPEAEGSSKSK